MEAIYQLVGDIDLLWFVSAGILILILDIFILGTTALLIVSGTLFLFSILKVFIEDPVLLTWSLPAILIVLFFVQRFVINATVAQKLPHQETRVGSFNATVKLAEDPTGSADYFYGYKDEKQAVLDESQSELKRYKAFLDDGRTYILLNDPKLKEGMKVKVKVSNDETARVIKYYE